MTEAQFNVLMVDPTAKVEERQIQLNVTTLTGYRIKGDGWNTFTAYTLDAAWSLAQLTLENIISESIA
jgi:hypothetical protein